MFKEEVTQYCPMCEEWAKKCDQLNAEKGELREFQKLLDGQIKFNKIEFELSLSSEIKRSEFLLKEFKKADKQRDNWREKAKKLKQTLQEIKDILEQYLDYDKRVDKEADVDVYLMAMQNG